MSKIIENVGLSGLLCPLDDKPKKFSTCIECTHGICPIYFIQAFADGIFPVYENEFHVSEAVGPPLLMKFKRENPYYLKPDALVDMALGSAFHQWNEMANAPCNPECGKTGKYDHEVYREYDLGPYKLIGTMDLVDFEGGEIRDIKTMGAYRTRLILNRAEAGMPDEAFHQVNTYRAAFFPEATKLGLDIYLKEFSGFAQRTYKLTQRIYPVNLPIYGVGGELDMVKEHIEDSLSDDPRNCTGGKEGETWGGLRCKKFCPNYTCFLYEGPEYSIKDVE